MGQLDLSDKFDTAGIAQRIIGRSVRNWNGERVTPVNAEVAAHVVYDVYGQIYIAEGRNGDTSVPAMTRKVLSYFGLKV